MDPNKLINRDPDGAREARELDESLESAVHNGLRSIEGLNEALEAGKKASWPLVLLFAGFCAFIVKSTLFYAEQAQFQEQVRQNQADGKAFRDATTAHLDQIDRTQQATDAANRTLFTNQQIAINRLTDIVDLLREKKG